MGKRKTHEEYVKELSIVNSDIEAVDKYIDAKTPIKHHCKKHDVYWNALPTNTLKGKGCKECAREKIKNKNTKSNEEYVKQLKNKNPNVEALEPYIDSCTPILHRCKKHDLKWKAMPINILRGCGCSKCKSERISNAQFKPHEDYVEELSKKNPHIEVIEQYAGVDTLILHYCKKHDIYWKATPPNVLKGCGCPECVKEKIRDSLVKTHEEYTKELLLKNPNVEVVDKYINANIPIKHHCLIHDVYWNITPSNALKGCGCPKCRSEKIIVQNAFTHETYVNELKLVNPNIIVIGRYINMKTPILHKCLIHNEEWTTTPGSTLQGCGCPVCRSEKISEKLTKTHEEYTKELKIINPNVIAVERYVDCHTPILHKCLIDGNEWYITPSNILSGYGCPQCNQSKGEKMIRLWLDENNINYIPQYKFDDCRDIRPLPFDFYLPDYNKCVEYDGMQHFKPVDFFGGQEYFEYTVKHDNIKNKYCENNGIYLLRIPYFIKNVEEELNNFLFI